jgi:hypothetical protein
MNEPLRISSEQALSAIADKWLAKGWGLRHLWIGYSGSGKSVANAILSEYLKSHGVMTIAVDQKSPVSRYDDTIIRGVEELPFVVSRSCVLRGFRFENRIKDRINFDALASQVWRMGCSGVRVALVPDELKDAQQSPKAWEKPSGQRAWMDVLYEQGREVGISVIAATQLPQEIPRPAYSLSDSIGFYRQEAHEAEYYKRLNILSESDIQALSRLDEYEFLLWRRGDSQRYISRFTI